jgi:hypothetical protein
VGSWKARHTENEKMKSIKAAHSSVGVANLSVPDAEEIIEEALNELAFSSDPGLARALHFLAPSGYQAIVELCSENGRSKRRNASAEVWSPEEDEVRIYFERIGDAEGSPRPSRSPRPVVDHSFDDDEDSQEAQIPADLDARVKELCAALAEAERGGHAFIALKWFRDSFLPRKAFRWNQHPRVAPGCARGGHSARRRADQQDCQPQDARVSHHHHPPQPR